MTVVTTSTAATATAYSNQRKVDRCQNGVLWTMFWDGTSTTTASMHTRYSTDNGATWTAGTHFGFAGTGTTYTPNGSLFIDLDDYAHVVYKDRSDGYIYYRRGTPNAARTAWTWSAAVTIRNVNSGDYPDIVAHREGAGWAAHIVFSQAASASFDWPLYCRVDITSGGTATASAVTDLATAYGNTVHKFPSIDFNHTGDGKTVAGGTPHLYAAWSAGATDSGKGIRFKKATYSSGSWTWGTEREIDSAVYVANGQHFSLNCLFDGTRAVIGGTLYPGSGQSLRLYDRDAADTTTTARTLTTNTAVLPSGPSMTYDEAGNVRFFGHSGTSFRGEGRYVEWERASGALTGPTVFDTSDVNAGTLSVKRGYSNSKIEFIYTDGSASPYSVTYGGISLNAPPNSPTNLSPDGATIDKDVTQRFSWSFSDPDAGDTQSAYELRYRLIGAPSWTTVAGGASQFHDFAGGTFAAGDYEWQVRTTDAAGAVGPFSSSATFTAASTPATPTITDPLNNGTISTENYTVRWTASTQEKYQVRTVADNAGSPNTAVVYQDTGTVTSSSDRSRTMAFNTNLRTEHVQVRVQVAGLWSSWASVLVNVSYTLPATPTIGVSGNDATAAVTVMITNPVPTGSEPTVVGNDVWVRVAAGGRKDIDRPVGGDGVRIAAGVANNGTFVDRAPRANTAYEYRVRAIGSNDVSAWSVWTPVS